MRKRIHLGITRKLIIYLLVATFVPLLLFGIGAVSQSKLILRYEMDKYIQDLLNEKQKNIELMVSNAENLITNIGNSEDIKNILSSHNLEADNYNKLADQTKIGYILNSYSSLKGLVSIDIFSLDGTHYYVGDTLSPQKIRVDLKEKFLKEDLQSKDKIIWNGIEDNININSKYHKVVALSSLITAMDKDTLKERPIGIIIVNIDMDTFGDVLRNYKFDDVNYTLVDGENRVIYSSNKDIIGKAADRDFNKKSKNKGDFYKEKIDNKSMISEYSSFNKGGWVISGSIPDSVINEKTSAISKNIIMLLVTCFLLVLILSSKFSRQYLVPIKKMIDSFRQIKNDTIDLNMRLKTDLKDEIGELIMWFNTFLESLQAMKIAEADLEKELRNDFRRTVENLQNIVFKLKLNDEEKIVFTLFEGKLAHKLFLHTEDIKGMYPEEIFKGQSSESVGYYCEKAFNGEVTSFEGSLMGKFFYITLSPITENNLVVEVVGSAIDITELKEAEQTIRFMAYYDSLTALPNRILFKERVSAAIAHAHRSGNMCGIMFLDLDHFKLINDTLGHAIGDNLLQLVANKLKECVNEDDIVARMGGDEFILLFPYVNEVKDIEETAQKILQILREPFIIENNELYASTSIGISLYPLDGMDMDTLIKNADMAMYRAKDQGRDNYQFFTTAMNQKAQGRLEMERSIRKALEKNEFSLVYQPKVDIQSGKITGAEALIRWFHPKLGLIPPSEFIPIAEESGLIVPIGEWVLYTACKQHKEWMDVGYENLTIAINISAKQFQQEDFIERITNIIEETKVEPSLLELEITENSIMQDTNKNIITLNELKSRGMKISIDDFGTGFSSLSYIMKFAADILKIDKSFISNLSVNSSNTAITIAIINMSRSLNLKVVAEGVETNEQLEFLKAQNCNEMQGYLFSKPVPPEEFEKMLTDDKRL